MSLVSSRFFFRCTFVALDGTRRSTSALSANRRVLDVIIDTSLLRSSPCGSSTVARSDSRGVGTATSPTTSPSDGDDPTCLPDRAARVARAVRVAALPIPINSRMAVLQHPTRASFLPPLSLSLSSLLSDAKILESRNS